MGNKNIRKHLILGDLHMPNHDIGVLNVINKFAKWYKPDSLILNGDLIDLDSITSFNEGKPGLSENLRLVKDIDYLHKALEFFDNIKSIKKRIAMVGNHENRINKYYQKHPELKGIFDVNTEIEVSGYECVPNNQYYKIGKDTIVLHGLFTNIYASRKHIDTFGCNVIFSHSHRMTSFSKTNINGTISGYNIGCTCKKDLHYLDGRPTDWVHGFCIVEENIETGKSSVYIIQINDNQFIFNGKLFKV